MEPYVINIERETIRNDAYRRVLFTTKDQQLVLMSLQPGEDIPAETHSGTQFIRIEKGIALAQINNFDYLLEDGDSITIPPDTLHYIKNLSNGDLKLYTLYCPPEHKEGEYQLRQ